MASLYLLGHNDHYTSHVFRPFYWLPYVNKIKSDWQYTDIDHKNIEENGWYMSLRMILLVYHPFLTIYIVQWNAKTYAYMTG